MVKSAAVDEYIGQFSKEIQKILSTVRKAIREAAPQAEEKISYGMPAFSQGKILVYFAALKNHLGFYPTNDGITAFQKEIASYKSSKGAIQFPYTEPVPYDLIARITKHRLETVSAKPKTGARKSEGVSQGVYLALLRGLNVGGSNVIKMADLKEAFTGLGFSDVRTYIQSGNVMFCANKNAGKKSESALPKESALSKERGLSDFLESELSRKFSTEIKIVLLGAKEIEAVVKNKPEGFGDDPDWHYDVMFIRKPLTAQALYETVSLKEGVDTAVKGKGVIYFSKLIARAGQSHLPRIIQSPHYKTITIRNWNTVTKLAQLMTKAVSP
jgi:uncharacterized protein (DUF1697 family)/uncharacterized protein YdhG (YjbR/CyaY superfamily)